MNQYKPQTPSDNRDPNPQHIPGFDPTLHLDPKIEREIEDNQARSALDEIKRRMDEDKKKSNQH